MQQLFRLIIPICITATLLQGCKKFVEPGFPEDVVLSDLVFTSDERATSTVTAIYGSMINGTPSFSNFLVTVYGGLSSDEFERYNPSSIFQEFANNDLTASNGQVRNIWSTAYKHIYYANAIIEGLSKSTSVSADVKESLRAECGVVRALSYYYLVNLFGDVPLVLTSDYQKNLTVPRASTKEIYDHIITDLEFARTRLPISFPGGERVRPTKFCALALLARVYLHAQDWVKAESCAGEIIKSGLFTPLPTLQNTFLKNSREAIWQLAPNSGTLQETRQLRPSGTTPQIFLSHHLLSSFEPEDQRRQRWIDSITFQTTKYYYPAKYRNTTTAVTEYYVVFRAAEQYLIRAEARTHLGDVANAINDINVVRSRAGLPSLSSSLTSIQILEAIYTERRTELFAEWAHRWFDLKRSNQANTVLSSIKSGWQATDTLYPIPQEDIQTNISLTQNSGY